MTRRSWPERSTASRDITGRPVVIVTEVDPSVGVPSYDGWWDVPVAEVSDSPSVRAAYDGVPGTRRHGTQPAVTGARHPRIRS